MFVCARFPALAALAVCCALVFSSVPAPAQEGEKIELASLGLRLVLPENWRPAQETPEMPGLPKRGWPGDALFMAGAFAPTGEAVTVWTITSRPSRDLAHRADFTALDLPLLNDAEQEELRHAVQKTFAAEWESLTGQKVEQSRIIVKTLNRRHAVLLTARCRQADEVLIVNNIYYFLPGRALILTFATPREMISILAADIAYILDNFEPPEAVPGQAD